MAYENMTYETILQRMMDTVSVLYPNVDNREGSIIFNALAPAALELAIMYTELNNVLSESFVGTASREYLLQACSQMGIDTSAFKATNGVHKGVFNVEVPVDSRWNHDLYNYTVTEYIGVNADGYHEYKLTCETYGKTPNVIVGDLIPITHAINNLTLAKVTECLIEGEDEMTDDEIRSTYYDYINTSALDGNVTQYKRWCDEYNGVGNSKVIPLWNGDNTVKVSILSSSNRAASEELIQEFQNYLDPNSEGMGNGVAPIGSFVTVSTATEIPISVTADVTMRSCYTDTTIISTALENYFSNIAYNKDNVAYMSIGAVILGVDGVESIDNLLINGNTLNISLGNEEVPVLGATNWTVS